MFANDLALLAIRGQKTRFPEGSIIVREKLAKVGDTEPNLLAVMIKRETGYNPDGGDWQFLLTNGKGTKVRVNQRRGDCLSCHLNAAATDFVHPLR